MTTLTATNTWSDPIVLVGARRVQVRNGGPILVCTEAPEHEDDGFLIVEGDSRVFIPCTEYPSIWIKSRIEGRESDVYIGGETLFG